VIIWEILVCKNKKFRAVQTSKRKERGAAAPAKKFPSARSLDFARSRPALLLQNYSFWQAALILI
jgi:hypothetical protein